MSQFLLFPLSRLRRFATKQSIGFRRSLAVGLAALLFLSPLSFNASARPQSTSSPKLSQEKQFTIYQDENGNIVCRVATLEERLQQGNVDRSKLGLRQINHLKGVTGDNLQAGTNDATGLTIILRATTQLQGNAAAVAAFNRAAQNWESIIKSPMTIYLDVDYGTTNFGQPWGANVLGATGSPGHSYAYQSVRTNLNAEATGEGNATKQAIFNALPSTAVPTDLGNASTTDVSDAIARAIGLLPATAQSTDPAAHIAFNSAFTYDFDPTDGITPGQTDFDAVATHEIGHALGFDSDAGQGSSRPSIWDLYRFRTGTTSVTFPTGTRIMTIGGSPDPLQFYFAPGNSELGLSTGGPSGSTSNGGDGWQSSHWKHTSQCSGSAYIGIMDPAISSGCRRTITSNDALALGTFGYNLNNSNAPPPPPPPPPPPANDNFASAQAISGCSGSVIGTTIGATNEKGAGEPDHDPATSSSDPSSLSDGSPNHTVWYQWQAPATGSTTITTEGSDFDTIVAVYTGSSLNSLAQVVFNDDVDPGVITTSTLTFNATAGTTYRIAVDGWGGDTGSIKLNWTESNCPPPKTDQTITFGALSSKTFGDASFTVSATASSGLPVSFSVFSGPATISGNTVTITGGGTVTIRASQAGNASFNPAPDVDQSFTVAKANQTITFGALANKFFGDPDFTVSATASSGLAVAFSASGQCTVSGSTVQLTNTGSCTITASQGGNANYNPATNVSQSFNINATALPAVQLSASSYTVGEGAGNVAITVNRADSSVPGNVDYATSDPSGLTGCNQVTGNASSRCDYAITVGTLRFAAGESSKTIFIPIVDDGYVEGNETFTIRLNNPSGMSLGTNSTATITITDNDSSTSNPIVGVPFFVRQQYIDFLGREPDPAGAAGWQNILNNCPPSGKDSNGNFCDRIEVSAGFFRSPEFQDRGSFIFRFYSATLGRNPFYAEFMPDLAKVSGFLSDAQLEANKVAFVQEFMTRPEFVNKYGGLSNTAFVDTLIQTSGLSSHPLRGPWIDVLNNGTATRADVLRAFTESAEVYTKFYNQVFVVMQYFGYLRRDPDAQYTQWIQTMTQTGDYRTMINGFMGSIEYVLRFGP